MVEVLGVNLGCLGCFVGLVAHRANGRDSANHGGDHGRVVTVRVPLRQVDFSADFAGRGDDLPEIDGATAEGERAGLEMLTLRASTRPQSLEIAVVFPPARF